MATYSYYIVVRRSFSIGVGYINVIAQGVCLLLPFYLGSRSPMILV